MTEPADEWLAGLGAAPPPWRVTRPRPDALVVCGRSGWRPAVLFAALPTLLLVVPVAVFTGSWPGAFAAWLAATLGLAWWFARPTWITLTPAALTLQEGRAPPVVVPWDLVDGVVVRRGTESVEPQVVHSLDSWVVAGPHSTYIALQVRRAPIGPNAGTLQLAGGLNDAAIDWLYRAVDSAWKGRRVVA